jgi:hypothetical protein
LKTRTDTRLYAANVGDFLAALIRRFPLGEIRPLAEPHRTQPGADPPPGADPQSGADPPPGQAPHTSVSQRGRLVALDLATRRYVPFHLSDILMFGYYDDMAAYWQHPAYGPEVVLAHPHRFGDFVRDAIPEVLLCTNYLSRAGSPPPRTITAWWQTLADRCLIVDRSALEFFWPKYNYVEDHRLSGDDRDRNLALIGFRDWLNLAAYGKLPGLEVADLADCRLNELVPAA